MSIGKFKINIYRLQEKLIYIVFALFYLDKALNQKRFFCEMPKAVFPETICYQSTSFLVLIMYALIGFVLFNKLKFVSKLLIFIIYCYLNTLNFQVVTGVDCYASYMLFYSLLLQFGEFSTPETKKIYRFSRYSYQIQLSLGYLATATWKVMDPAWRNGIATWMFVPHEKFYANFMSIDLVPTLLCWLIIIIQYTSAVGLWTRHRNKFFGLCFCFHLGIFFYMNLNFFAVIVIINLLAFLIEDEDLNNDSLLRPIGN